MPYTITKLTRNRAIIKIIGAGTNTISLSNIAMADQTLDAGNASVSISRVFYSTASPTTITRDGTEVLSLQPGNFDMHLASGGAGIDSKQDKDLVVTTGGVGTVLILLNKESGYIDPDFQGREQFQK